MIQSARLWGSTFTLVAMLAMTCGGQVVEDESARDARMAWWRDARFGMFIHWGVYAVPAGEWKGEKVRGISEWIMLRAQIPVAEYKAFAKDFNPVKYDADAWVSLAKEAGMKYIVITSKHHDGFALYDSKVTDWDIVDATPYGKDLLRPLVDAAKREGLKIGFYYSQAQDWNHPGGAKAGYEEGDGWDEAHKGDFDEYLDAIARPQVEEILTNYDIDVLWWDTPRWMTKERAEKLLPELERRPNIVWNNRLGGGYKGDTDTPEQHIPEKGIPGRDWETCMTMNTSWGYKHYDDNWKSTEMLIHNLVDIASKGGNYLLNVGPTAQGEIPQPSIDRLKEIGSWMKQNSASIYGTTATPVEGLTWGRCTKKVHEDGATLYLHVFDWPEDGKIQLPGLKNSVRSARLLVGGQALETAASVDGVTVEVPAEAPDAVDTVIVLEVEGELVVEKLPVRQGEDGQVRCLAGDAELHPGQGGSFEIRTEGKGRKQNIGYWTNPENWAEWQIDIRTAGTFAVSAVVAAPTAGSIFVIEANGQKLRCAAPGTDTYDDYSGVNCGQLTFEEPGTYALSVKPEAEGWKPINVRRIRLKPLPAEESP